MKFPPPASEQHCARPVTVCLCACLVVCGAASTVFPFVFAFGRHHSNNNSTAQHGKSTRHHHHHTTTTPRGCLTGPPDIRAEPLFGRSRSCTFFSLKKGSLSRTLSLAHWSQKEDIATAREVRYGCMRYALEGPVRSTRNPFRQRLGPPSPSSWIV